MRSQSALFNKVKSTSMKVYAGVPQRTVRPNFISDIYINDLFNAVNGVKITMYADDCVVYYAKNRIDSVKNTSMGVGR